MPPLVPGLESFSYGGCGKGEKRAVSEAYLPVLLTLGGGGEGAGEAQLLLLHLLPDELCARGYMREGRYMREDSGGLQAGRPSEA